MNDEIKVWIQFFFDDGTVSQGKRIPACYLDEGYETMLESITFQMVRDLNRTKGFRLIWGAGNMKFNPISLYPGEESETLASES